MKQITINIEDSSILPHLKKILNAINGVSIAKSKPEKKSSLDLAMEDVKAGRTKRFESADAFFKDLGI